ncbi:hypothetical protein [Salmonella enterica]|nr:hypothetical protein [Salmonella enterica]
MIAAKLNCAPDVHAIKEALALALPSVQNAGASRRRAAGGDCREA